jgi:hypothetical protein
VGTFLTVNYLAVKLIIPLCATEAEEKSKKGGAGQIK